MLLVDIHRSLLGFRHFERQIEPGISVIDDDLSGKVRALILSPALVRARAEVITSGGHGILLQPGRAVFLLN